MDHNGSALEALIRHRDSTYRVLEEIKERVKKQFDELPIEKVDWGTVGMMASILTELDSVNTVLKSEEADNPAE